MRVDRVEVMRGLVKIDVWVNHSNFSADCISVLVKHGVREALGATVGRENAPQLGLSASLEVDLQVAEVFAVAIVSSEQFKRRFTIK